MINIRNGLEAPHHLTQLRQWYLDEWGKIDSFEGNHPELVIPPPLLAIDNLDQLLGGLAFSTFGWPTEANIEVWINAVYVAPEQRGKSIASKLISAGERSAAAMNIERLIVYTQQPALYQKLGWQLAKQTGDDCTLTKNLASTQLA